MTTTMEAVEFNDWLLEQLPNHMAEHNDFLRRFLRIITEIADSVRADGDALPHLLDLELTTDRMVRYVGAWIGLDLDPRMDADHQRRLVRHGGAAVRWRGTRPGLEELLEMATGGSVDVSDTGGIFAEGCAPVTAKHVWVELERTGLLTADHLVALVAEEIPADCTFELWVAGVEVYSERPAELEAAS